MNEIDTLIAATPQSDALIKRIRTRRRRLAKVAKDLKAQFIGIDSTIDDIMRNIEVWYAMPEIISRPVIVNLWGMTGVGKTDLVRKLVRALEFSDRFLEIQLCNSGSSTGGYSTLSGQMKCSNLEAKQPGVLLLDEIQRFRTINEEGKEIMDYKFQDLWMLLSDGKFSGSTEKEDIMRVMFEHVYYSIRDDDDEEKKKKKEESEAVKKHKYRQSYYTAKLIKKTLRLPDKIEDIMLWGNEKKMQVAIEKMEDQSTYEGDDFSKLLIFVSGNIDEAYRMSGDSSDSNRDADVLNAFSKKINVITIKKALEKRFKPEQISRFGNTHIIYQALDKASYERIIERRIGNLLDSISTQHNIKITCDKSVYDFVYRNGVFPSQGTRPLFSTISSYIENSMPSLVLGAIEHQKDRLNVIWGDNLLIGQGDGFEVSVKCEGSLDLIKKNNDSEKRVITSVHEAGHAIVYATLIGAIPTQIVANMASETTSGFVGIHSVNYSKDGILAMAAVYMAGSAAEELVFGESLLTNGASGDISHCTTMLAQAVREWGQFGGLSKVEDVGWVHGKFANNDNSEKLNAKIETIITEQRKVAMNIVRNNLPLLKECSDLLIKNGKAEPEEFKKMCERHGIAVKSIGAKTTIYENYSDKYNKFFTAQ